jgi:hypothetical protein
MDKSQVVLASELDSLHAELRALIASSRQRLAVTVNAELSQLYWSVGRRLSVEVLAGARAQYGVQLMKRLGERLEQEFGRGFEVQNLRRMVQFAQAFSSAEIVASLMRQLSWTHFLLLIPMKSEAARMYYAQQSAADYWSVRELRRQIERKAYERNLIASAELPPSPEPTSTGAESSHEQVELLQMHKDGITVAEYWTELPPKADLERQLRSALADARERLERRRLMH